MYPGVILSIISGEASAAAKRARLSALEYLIAGIAALVGFAFLLLAAYIYLAGIYGGLATAIGFGAAFLAAAVLLLIYHRVSARRRARRARERMSRDAVALAGPIALAVLPALLSKRSAVAGMALSAVAALGYAIYRENKGHDGNHEDDF